MADNTNIETTNTVTPETNAPVASTNDLEKRIKDLETQLAKQKKALDAACTDAANNKDKARDWQAKYESTLTEAQKAEEKRKAAEAERVENEKRLREENETLKREKTISAYSNMALSLGYDADLANQTAEAMANGDMTAVFAGIGQLIQTVKTKTATENLGKQSSLSAGTPPSTATVNLDEDNKYRKWMGLPPRKN